MTGPVIKVTSKSFSSHPILRKELRTAFPGAVFNDEGRRYTEEDVIGYFNGAEGVVVGLEPITDQVLAACPDLKIVSKYGVGLDNIDQAACADRHVHIGWTGGVNRRGVAEMTLCYMIGLSRNVLFAARGLRDRQDWTKAGGTDLSSRTVGLIGVGHIGKEVIGLLRPFECKILVNDIIDQTPYYEANGVQETSKEDIYANADIISIHLPLDNRTRALINAGVFRAMKNDAYFINVARGGIVDQAALKAALADNQIAGAAIDVFETEPSGDTEFLNLPNLYCTPHTGGSSAESILAMGRSSISHLVEYFGSEQRDLRGAGQR